MSDTGTPYHFAAAALGQKQVHSSTIAFGTQVNRGFEASETLPVWISGKARHVRTPKNRRSMARYRRCDTAFAEQNLLAACCNLRFAGEYAQFASRTGVPPMTIKIVKVLVATVALAALVLGTDTQHGAKGWRWRWRPWWWRSLRWWRRAFWWCALRWWRRAF